MLCFVLQKKKSFFCNKHEETSNVGYRNTFIKKSIIVLKRIRTVPMGALD